MADKGERFIYSAKPEKTAKEATHQHKIKWWLLWWIQIELIISVFSTAPKISISESFHSDLIFNKIYNTISVTWTRKTHLAPCMFRWNVDRSPLSP
jgi:hypothetical protein